LFYVNVSNQKSPWVIAIEQLLDVALELSVAGALVIEPCQTLVSINLDGAKEQIL